MVVMEKGDFVRIDYVGKLESGEILDLTREDVAKKEKIYNEKMKYGPVSVVIGSGFVLPGLEKALEGMKPGDKKTAIIEPADGFGQRKADMVKTVNSKVFGDGNVDPRPGMIVDFSGLKGNEGEDRKSGRADKVAARILRPARVRCNDINRCRGH